MKSQETKDKFYVFINSYFSSQHKAKSSKLTTRKFFCSHFHSITIHSNFQTILLEIDHPRARRKKLWRPATNFSTFIILTSSICNRYDQIQCSAIISCQTKFPQETGVIYWSPGRFLFFEKRRNSSFSQKFIQQNTSLFQAHLQRIQTSQCVN